MNKQQLASTIWQSANQMRSKIEANEYKDYILGFMFYKYLSDREISFLKGEKYSDEDIKKVTADDEKLVKHISENIGYFIAYEDLFSSWLSNHWSSLQKPRWMRCFQTSIIVWYRVDITCCQRDHIQQHLDSM